MTTSEIVLARQEAAGLKVGQDFCLAFSPERVDPGNPRYGTANTPKVSGGIVGESSLLAALLSRQAIERVVSASAAALGFEILVPFELGLARTVEVMSPAALAGAV